MAYGQVNSTLTYNNTLFSMSKYSNTSHIYFNKTVTTPDVDINTEVPFYYNISVVNETNFIWEFNQTVIQVGISSNCTLTENYTQAVQFCGYYEQSPDVNLTFDMNVEVNLKTGDTIYQTFGFNFSNTSECHSLCIEPTTANYTADLYIEFGTGIFTDRKYYMVDYVLDNVSDTVNLYHLDTTNASDVILTVYDKSTGDRIPDAYVKVIRYYPELANGTSTAKYKTVEVEKTDLNGQTIGKMMLADVWYKFIVEYPYGTVLLNSDIQKILSTTIYLPVSLSSGNLLQYFATLNTNTVLDCDWTVTKTCTYTWSTADGRDVTGILRIYENTGLASIMLYEDTLTTSTGSISYLMPYTMTGKVHYAEGWIQE